MKLLSTIVLIFTIWISVSNLVSCLEIINEKGKKDSSTSASTSGDISGRTNVDIKEISHIQDKELPSWLDLTSRKFEQKDFASFEPQSTPVTIIVALSQYSPRHLRSLFSSLKQLNEKGSILLGKNLQIIIAHYGPGSSIQHDTLHYYGNRYFESSLLYLAPEDYTDSTKLTAALNRASTLATGDFILFLSEYFEELTSSSLLKLVKVGLHPEVGVVAPLILDASTGAQSVYSAGIDFILSKNPHKPSWGGSSWTGNYDYYSANGNLNSPPPNNQTSTSNTQKKQPIVLTEAIDVPVLLHRFQGYLEGDSRIENFAQVLGVSHWAMLVKTKLFEAIGRFDEAKFSMSYFDVDLCFKMRKTMKKSCIVSSNAKASVTNPYHDSIKWYGASPSSSSSFSSTYSYTTTNSASSYDHFFQRDDALSTGSEISPNLELVKEDHKKFLESYLDDLDEYLRKDWLMKDLTIVWNMDCGTGAVLGFTTEAVNILMELHKIVRVKANSEWSTCKGELQKAGFPDATLKIMEVLTKRDEKEKSTDQHVVVIHKDPGRYDSGYSTYNAPDLLIGRSMYETDSIPPHWPDMIKGVDFVWVPSKFNVETFSKAAINASKLFVVPETIDLYHFDTRDTKNHDDELLSKNPTKVFSESPEQFGTFKKDFNFISVFKWETRKGWDILLRAYFDEFGNPEDKNRVALHIRSNMAKENFQAYEDFVTRYCQDHRLTRDSLPVVHFLNRFVSYSKLPAMYKQAQAFVLATHGEGWGLPLMEAMSMQLPVISTNWSGSTEFTNRNNSFMVAVESMIPVTSMVGHSWAQPSLSDLRRKMRFVYSNPTQSKLVGKEARSFLVEQFHSGVVAKRIVEKISSLRPKFQQIKNSRQSVSSSYYSSRYSYSTSFSNSAPYSSMSTGFNVQPVQQTTVKGGRVLTKSKITE